jgi:CBS-domain-containing membrane protein
VAAHDLEHVATFFDRLGLARIVTPLPRPVVWAVYVFLNGFLTIALLAALAVITRVPFVFPSLGPTAYLLFFLPRSEAASPHNTLVGHAIGLLCGYAAYWGMRIPGIAAGFHKGFDWPAVLAAGISLAATGALMILFDASHPPAGATTLIVSLGMITKPGYLVAIEAAVLLMTMQAFCLNRLGGVPYPVWKARRR